MSKIAPQKIALTINQIREQLLAHQGNISAVARACNVSRTAIQRRVNKSEILQTTLDECREARIDEAEDMLGERMRTSDTLLIFFLKTQGQKRGYIEKQQHEVKKEETGNYHHEHTGSIRVERAELDADIAARLARIIGRQNGETGDGGDSSV